MKIVKISRGWLHDKFGNHFAQIGTSTKLKLRSSVKDVTRARHGRVSPDIEQLTKRFEVPPQGIEDSDFIFGYESQGEEVPGSITTDKSLQEYVQKYPDDWKTVQKILGLERGRGRHASGFVVANRPIAEFIPLQEISGVNVTQFNMGEVEASGGIKMDFLVISSLLDIQGAIKLAQERSGMTIPESLVIDGKLVPSLRLLPVHGTFHDIWDLPEDQAVFRDVVEGRTETVFQFNTSGATQWLRHFNYWKDEEAGQKAIDSIEAMAAFTALDRPGPLDAFVETQTGSKHNMLVEYARRARGEKPVGEIALLTQLIPETLGVLCYQESLQRVYQSLMGCSGAEAEEFRRNIAKKKMDKVLKAYGPWMKSVGERYGEDVAKSTWEQIVTFGQYGFNKSHAVCYVHIAYACAFLKHHYPLEWWCSVLRNAKKNEISETFWRHCGHLVRYPDVTKSGESFEIVDGHIQAPISLLHGIGEKAHKQLLAGMPYRDIDDFCYKIEAHVVATSTPVFDKDGKPETIKKKKTVKKQPVVIDTGIQKVKRGHNALNDKVVYNLILSGTLDNLFPKEIEADGKLYPITDMDKLQLFEKARTSVTGDKYKGVNSSWSLTSTQRFQLRKGLLQAYFQPLMPLIEANERRVISKKNAKGEIHKFWLPFSLDKGSKWPKNEGRTVPLPFVTGELVESLDKLDPMPEGRDIQVVIPAYVMVQRHFTYQDGKEACEFGLDVDGKIMKFVKWPDRETGILDPVAKEKLKGAIVVCRLKKYRGDRPFGLEDIVVVQHPWIRKEKEDEDDDKEDEGRGEVVGGVVGAAKAS